MKVGIFFGDQLPEWGGGHTFNSEVLQSLMEYGGESSHTFILCSRGDDAHTVPLPAHIQIRKLPPEIERFSSRRFRNTVNVLSRVPYLRRRYMIKSDLELQSGNNNNVMEFMRANEIELMWYVTPTYYLTMDIPYITTVWDLQYRQQPYFPEVSISGQWDSRERIYTSLLRRSAFIIVGTETGKDDVQRLYQVPSERIKVLPFPTPDFALHASATDRDIHNKYCIPENYLFYPAQFWPHKNHVNLLLAIKRLRDSDNLIFPVVFAGSDQGNQTHIKQVVSQFNLSKQVYFLGFVPQEDLISLYRNAFALAFVTFFGPDNLPPLEAFALGCPVIASEVPGVREQLGDAAFFVDPKNEAQIAAAIKILYDDVSLRATLKDRGLQRASRWTVSDYIRRVFFMLDEFEPIRRCWSNTELYTDVSPMSSLNVAGEAAKE